MAKKSGSKKTKVETGQSDFQKIQFDSFLKAVKRIQKGFKLNYPSTVLQVDVMIIITTMISFVGPTSLQMLCEAMLQEKRVAYGYCGLCGQKVTAMTKNDLGQCRECEALCK